MVTDADKIVSTLTLKLNQKNADLLEQIKQDLEQKVSTKAILSLLTYPQRYRNKEAENKDLKQQIVALEKQIKIIELEYKDILNKKDLEIQDSKDAINNFLSSFEQLRNICHG